jgi:hypothetical protein
MMMPLLSGASAWCTAGGSVYSSALFISFVRNFWLIWLKAAIVMVLMADINVGFLELFQADSQTRVWCRTP